MGGLEQMQQLPHQLRRTVVLVVPRLREHELVRLRDGHVLEARGRLADHFDERARLRLLVSTGWRGRGVRAIALRHHG